jgi:hypothetical protein
LEQSIKADFCKNIKQSLVIQLFSKAYLMGNKGCSGATNLKKTPNFGSLVTDPDHEKTINPRPGFLPVIGEHRPNINC